MNSDVCRKGGEFGVERILYILSLHFAFLNLPPKFLKFRRLLIVTRLTKEWGVGLILSLSVLGFEGEVSIPGQRILELIQGRVCSGS